MRIQLKNILCATDFSDFSNHTIHYGAALAKKFGAKLYVCHVISPPTASFDGEAILGIEDLQNRITESAHRQYKKLINGLKIDSEPLITTGHVSDQIADIAQSKEVNLVILATHGRSGLKRLILGSVTERLMRTLHCPVLVVRSPEHEFISPADQEITLQRILIGCDFSPDSDLAFQYGLALAQEFQSELHLIHVIMPPVYKELFKSTVESRDEFQKDLRNQLTEKLTKMVPDNARTWCTPKIDLLAGQPHEEIIKYAVVHTVDLIILGIRGHSLIETLFVGSTTDRVIRGAPCPVLSICPTVQ